MAEDALRNQFKDIEIITENVLWPAEEDKCRELAQHLMKSFDIVTGVFPAQAVQAFWETADSVLSPLVMSPVSVPVKDRDKTTFVFCRWAFITWNNKS
jgi:hypothetical protein